ncbi:MAG TPA: ABC transporter permease, partial [Kineosporiaceae bacterium]|nr:ABC transporter permease [Kineosporiaceae bacterium]
MLRITLKGVRGHLLRFLLTVASVTLGTALIAGTYVLTDSINATFDKIFDASTAATDASVRGAQAGELGQGQGRARVPLPIDLVQKLRAVDGVADAQPDVQGSIVIAGKNGTAVRNAGAPALGFAYHPGNRTLHLVQGRGPLSSTEVALESSTLKRSGLKVGDTTRALVGQQVREVTVVGEIKFDAAIAGATMVLVDETTARAAFAPDGKVASFTLVAQRGVSQTTLRDRVKQMLPANAEVITAKDLAAEQKTLMRGVLGFVSTFLLAFAGISIFVGGFIIANTFSMLVAQRTRELALLRAVGAAKAQVIRVVLGEAAVVGLVGGLVGLGVGIGLAKGLQAVFGMAGLEISGGLPVLPRTVIVTVLVGVLVTVVSAVLPAVRAARIDPVAAMQDVIVIAPAGLRRRAAIGSALLAVGICLTVFAVTRSDVSWWAFLAGAALSVLGTLVFAPVATRPVVRVVAAPFVWMSGTVGRLARENALRVPRRTATTASALMIGLALISGASVMADSMKASVSDLIDQQLTADFVLDGGGALFPPSVAQAVAKLPGVRSVAPIGWVQLEVGKEQLGGSAGTAAGIRDNVKIQVLSGSLDALDSGQLLVSESTAKQHGWKVGSTVTATVGVLKGHSLTVGGVYKDSQVLSGQVIAPMDLYTQAIPLAQRADFGAYIKAAPGADIAAVKARIADQVKQYFVVSVQDGAEFKSSQSSQIDTMLQVLYALLALSVVIAVLGIINTLALSVFERTREIGLLRAVGLTRGQLSRTVTIEAVATAVFGAVLGTLLGLGLGVAVQHGLASSGLDVLSIPWVRITGIILG